MLRSATRVPERSATYRQVFGSGEFRALFFGRLVSGLGDQILRVALALLIYHDTDSPLLTALGYALTFLPWLVAGPLLTPFVDRYPRRALLVGGNLLSAVLVTLMVTEHLPIALLLVLVVLAESLSPPMAATYSALIPEILSEDRYVLGISVNSGMLQATQVVSFGLGGTLVAVLGARGCFALDAVSFVLSAVVLRVGLRHSYPPPGGAVSASYWTDTREGLRIALGRPRPRALLLLVWTSVAMLLIPEALAAPFAARVAHGGDSATGWLLSAQPIGLLVGLFVVGRLIRPSMQARLLRPLAVLCSVPLILFVLKPSLAGALALLAVSGFASSFMILAQGVFVGLIPPQARGRAFGVAAAGMQVAQGTGILIGGGAANVFGVTVAIAGGGVVGLAVMLGLSALPVWRPVPSEPAAAPAT